MSTIWAAVPAAGSGSRIGSGTAKQYLELHGRPIIDWSVSCLLASDRIRACAVALPEGHAARPQSGVLADSRVLCCTGGASRAASVAAALDVLPGEPADWVLVHDAARPCLPRDDLEKLMDRVQASGVGGLLARPQTDTLKRADGGGRVTATVSREGLWCAQTPQMFRLGELRAALANAETAGSSVTDEASAMELAGHPVQLVEGSPRNLKVTYPADLALAGYWLQDD